MKADLTRNTFDPTKHYARVLLQQGRVQLDADWNEQVAILLHYVQTLAADLIGPRGGPESNCGFQIGTLAKPSPNVTISPGRYYVDGLLCELQATFVAVTGVTAKALHVASWTIDGIAFDKGQLVLISDGKKQVLASVVEIDAAHSALTLDDLGGLKPTMLRRVTSYLTQPDYPSPPALSSLAAGGKAVVYLDVWERVISFVDDDRIREIALNGADTAMRTKVVWQVKVGPGAGDVTLQLDPQNRGLLRARSSKAQASTDPCTLSPNARYRGPENQLYRVEIHRGSRDSQGKATPPSFKWSRENGCVVFPIVKAGGNQVTLESLGRDDRFGLAEGDLVEIEDDRSVLTNSPNQLQRVQRVDRATLQLTLEDPVPAPLGSHPILRRWDQRAGAAAEGGLTLGDDNAATIPDASDAPWLDLENGVQIQFSPAPPGGPAPIYRAGDYWLIPARTTSGDVEWPTEAVEDSQGVVSDAPRALPPAGITHHYAPLANWS